MARMPIYWYLNGDLHKRLHIDRPKDIITAWSYSQRKRVGYTYSDVRRRMEPGFTTMEVSRMINRTRTTIFAALANGMIDRPPLAYALDENQNKSKYIWHEKNVIELHEYFSTVHRGKKRKDGLITPQAMPTLRELRAMLRNEEIMYVKEGDEFRPVWQAKEF